MNRILLFACAVALGFLAVKNGPMSDRGPANTPPSRDEVCEGITPLADSDFNWAALKQRVLSEKGPRVDSVDKALCLIPTDIARLRIAMMVNSRSLQKSSLGQPRAIAFSDGFKYPK